MKTVQDPGWKWPTHQKWYCRMEGLWKKKPVEDEDESPEDGLQCPFEVHTLLHEDNEDLSEVHVKLHSPYLIAVVRKHVAGVTEAFFCEKPSVDVKDLFHAWKHLKHELNEFDSTFCSFAKDKKEVSFGNGVMFGGNQCREESELDGNADAHVINHKSHEVHDLDKDESSLYRVHLQHLLRFLDEHFKGVSPRFEWMRKEGLTTYNMLWAFFTPGSVVRHLCSLSGEPCRGVISKKGEYVHKSWKPQNNKFRLKVKVMDFDGETYRPCTVTCKIKQFEGEVPIKSLPVCPWNFFPIEEQEDMSKHLVQRGRLFYDYAVLQPFRFMYYRGSLGFYELNLNGCFVIKRVNADGRCMVDLLSLAKMKPDWPLENAQPPSELLRDFKEKDQMEAMQKLRKKQPTDEDFQSAPAIVYGFSFGVKKWGWFCVGGLKEVTFTDDAFDKLVMRSTKQKDILRALVSAKLSAGNGDDNEETGAGVDIVAHKGQGCVVLCYGPPGTGKTLTAESLAETLHRPLWAISAFELGEDAGELERCLSEVLKTALRWRAIILLDEADGYLEHRSSNVEVKRNLMTGVFLRLLEYYAGVLFLTTNRVGSFDQAFLSRISFCLHYQALDDGQRSLIWQTLLAHIGLTSISEADLQTLLQCGQPLNGREIRNIISLAQTWAKSRGQKPCIKDVEDAVQLVVSGTQQLLSHLQGSVASENHH
ncbi:hypothetical protein KP509_06G061700 [Ceratopteris richardii]|nr:hypothetical protein KP509_06G061700 [Ceratopteris richardii]